MNEEVNKVYKTNDLSVFKTIKGNRPANPQHVRRLSHSIKQNGMLQNPIIVNDKMQVIDGQHRLLAAKEAASGVFYIIVDGYNLGEVQTLNLNQKNWTKEDFMNGYADMGVESYIRLREFYKKNKEFNLGSCIALCSNTSSSSASSISSKFKAGVDKPVGLKEIFEEGTWKGKDFYLAQLNADKLKMIKEFYQGYNRTSFVGTMIALFKNENFDFYEFLSKLRLQPTKLVDCANTDQYKALIEEIYNFRRRNKVNLRF